jgi:pyruvyltransferase
VPVGRRVDNFGDLLGPLLVQRMLGDRGLDARRAARSTRLFSIGSVLHYAANGDVVWGSGVNGKMDPRLHLFTNLDVRAVRGPLTRDFLRRLGLNAPEVYGDPALLLPQYFPELREWAAEKAFDLTVVPNVNEYEAYVAACPVTQLGEVLDPRRPVMACLERIARSRFVVGSSLHSVIVAESLGIPARLIGPRAEVPFKYADYYGGTGRAGFRAAVDVAEARELGGEAPPVWSPDALVDAFPWDLWTGAVA